jgi:V/A-type H+-transporting ATPase subunit E
MTQDLQQLLDKIQRDGVDKAKSEADKILEKAHAQARALVESAQNEATRIKASARQEAEAFERRAEETIRQSARDTVLTVEKSVSALLTNLLVKDVNAALNSSEVALRLVLEAVRAYLSSTPTLEVVAAATLADALRAKLAAEAVSGVTVVTDDTTGAGFRVRLANGRIEHAFTGAAVAESLARQLRPRLAALMKPNG